MFSTEFDWKTYERNYSDVEMEARSEAENQLWLLDRLSVEDVFDLFEPAIEPAPEE